ncbi:stage V sporulation protein AC [Gracilibacillus alcaliphilus]|uniref:stage V sporulation protein AC n=1 Tax=Gracilibacillus alcaliphilus TaxID=1401441 RepID=UPI00195626C5|nr:stage V sporulation protein AC [Gracilibacillus alcaliphilus]MBM7679360.1 stage V sporulation protein AC [Gracilibacillus alcaliphilus]
MKEPQGNYKNYEQKKEPKRPVVKNCIRAFLVGGLICVIGQVISMFYMYFFDFTEQTVGNPTIATLIFITMLLTGFGVYDKMAQFAGAGTAVPVTGFGNAVISAAIEHRTEGFVQGVGGNMFKLAGSVILFGVFSAFIIALIKTIISYWSGA